MTYTSTSSDLGPGCGGMVFGRSHKIHLYHLLGQKFSKSPRISPELRASLLWFRIFLSTPQAREYVQPRACVDLVVFSDASLTGLGVCVATQSRERKCFAAQTPRDFSDRIPSGSNQIFLLELLAALMAVKVVSSLYPAAGGLNFVLFIDNNASLSTLVRSFSKCPFGLAIVSEFWLVADHSALRPWVERVPSSLNLADEPSRAPCVDTVIFPFERVWAPSGRTNQ